MRLSMGGAVYRNNWQAKKVRLVTWMMAVIALGCAGGAAALLVNGEFWTALLVATLGTAPFVGMLYYCSIYAKEIRLVGDQIEIDVLTLTGLKTHRMPRGGARFSQEKRGRMISARGQFIDTPWLSLYSEVRRRPFLVDLQAEEIDRAFFVQLSSR